MGGSKGRGIPAGKGKSAPRLSAVDAWDHLPKKWLKPYPDRASGRLLKANLKQKEVAAWLTPNHSELVARPAMGLNLSFATIEVGFEALAAAAAGEEATGIAKCAAMFKAADLLPLVQLAQVEASADATAQAEAIMKLLEFAGDDAAAGKRLKALNLLADTSSRLWAFSVRWAELIAAAADAKTWAKNVPQPKLQHSSLSAWLQKPKSLRRLADSTAAAYQDMFHWGGKKQGRKAFGAETDDEAAAGSSTSASSSGSGDSSSEKKAKTKNKKKQHQRRSTNSSTDKKKRNRRKASSSAEERQKRREKFQDKPSKKDTKKKAFKKAKKPRSSASSKASSTAPAKKRKSVPQMEALYTEWRQSDAQAAVIALEAALEEIGTMPAPDSTFPGARLQDLLGVVPESLRPAALASSAEADAVPGTDARATVQCLLAVAKSAEAFYAAQQQLGGASTGS